MSWDIKFWKDNHYQYCYYKHCQTYYWYFCDIIFYINFHFFNSFMTTYIDNNTPKIVKIRVKTGKFNLSQWSNFIPANTNNAIVASIWNGKFKYLPILLFLFLSLFCRSFNVFWCILFCGILRHNTSSVENCSGFYC